MYADALQYTPIFHGAACWQLYSGSAFQAPSDLPVNEWVHVRMEIQGDRARVFLDGSETPALDMTTLMHGVSTGRIGVKDTQPGAAWYSNFAYRHDDTLAFPQSPTTSPPSRMLMDWELSRPFAANQLDPETYPNFYVIFNGQWRVVAAESSGLVNLSREIERGSPEPARVLARTILRSDRQRAIVLSLAYSDDVVVYLNGQKRYSGRNGYRSRDPSFVGMVGLFDAVTLPLEKGINEVMLIVSDAFGGWGFMAQTDRRVQPPIVEHGALTKVWETPAVFEIPESALFDAHRNVIYVSSFAKVGRVEPRRGFISKLTPDGEIEELNWVTGLDGPCGMAIHDSTLYVVESSGHLVAIDVMTGEIIERYPTPGSSFLNDLTIDADGTLYISNTSRSPKALDVYRFRDGKIDVWKDGFDLHRSNGLFAHDGHLIVGSTGDGLLKSVDLTGGCTRTIACLGAGVIDGIRVDPNGNYLVSHWEGKVYRISPEGDVVEILDVRDEGINLADFEFIKENNLLVVPTFTGNKVVAYRLGAD